MPYSIVTRSVPRTESSMQISEGLGKKKISIDLLPIVRLMARLGMSTFENLRSKLRLAKAGLTRVRVLERP